MEKNVTSQIWLASLLVLVVLVTGLFIACGSINKAIDSKQTVNVPSAQEIADLVVIPEAEFPEYDFSGDYVLTKDDYEKVLQENTAEELVLEEIDSRDFKKAIFNALVEYGEDIENYKDITKTVVRDIEVDVDEEIATVTVDLKVYYYVDGDEDEDFKARLEEFDFVVDDLIVEDDFEDAEVDYPDLVINKVY